MLDFYFINRFKKDLKLMEKRHKDMGKITDIMASIIWEEPLSAHCEEHILSGNYEGLWDCHIEPDWLLIYEH